MSSDLFKIRFAIGGERLPNNLNYLISCKDPSDIYHKMVFDTGFIPNINPISDTLPGALFSSSTPDNLIFAGMHNECFDKEELRHTRKVDIPHSVRSLTFSSRWAKG